MLSLKHLNIIKKEKKNNHKEFHYKELYRTYKTVKIHNRRYDHNIHKKIIPLHKLVLYE
jgi:hypothetical protein